MALNTLKEVALPPEHAPGKDVSSTLKRSVLVQKANQVTHDAWSGDGTLTLFSVPANTLVQDILIQVVGAFGAAPSFTIGDGGDVDRFMDNTQFAGNTTGFKSMRGDAQPGSKGYEYTSADTIDIVQTGTPSAGTLDAWLFYIPNSDELGL